MSFPLFALRGNTLQAESFTNGTLRGLLEIEDLPADTKREILNLMTETRGTPFLLVTLHCTVSDQQTHSFIEVPSVWKVETEFPGIYCALIGQILDKTGYTGTNKAPIILNVDARYGATPNYLLTVTHDPLDGFSYPNETDFRNFIRELWLRWGDDGEFIDHEHNFPPPEKKYAPTWETPKYKHSIVVFLNIRVDGDALL